MDALRIYGPPDERGVPVLFYLCLPIELACDARLTKAQIALAAILASHLDSDGHSYTCWPGTKRLMELTRLSRRGVQTGLAALERAGWIDRRVNTGKRPARVIDLLWRRPEPKGKAHGRAPSGASRCASKAQPAAHGIRSKEPDPRIRVARPQEEEPNPEPDPTPDQVAEWEEIAGSQPRSTDGVLARLMLSVWRRKLADRAAKV